jgi:hypothetical protein
MYSFINCVLRYIDITNPKVSERSNVTFQMYALPSFLIILHLTSIHYIQLAFFNLHEEIQAPENFVFV